jgi:hypothetical protein
MAKGQKRSNREIRKPKMSAAERSAASPPVAVARSGHLVAAAIKKKS